MIRLALACAVVEAAVAALGVRWWLNRTRDRAIQHRRAKDGDDKHMRGHPPASPQHSHALEIGRNLHNLRSVR